MRFLRIRDLVKTTRRQAALLPCVSLIFACSAPSAAADASSPPPALRQYCYGCHGKAAVAGLNLEKIAADAAVGDHFQHWQKVAAALEEKRMPPAKMPQPTAEQRKGAIEWIRTRLDEFAQKHAGDPGRVTVRRLTSGEYAYTIQDLTGLELRFDDDLAGESVGGEGFANLGDVQFVDDANLERYLQAAKRVANHAVIGAGPLSFFEHAGKSGFELSAIDRIQRIYRANGFRAVAGEGAKPYGLDRYGKAFFVGWQYRNRQALGRPTATLVQFAAEQAVPARFAQHIWSLMNQPSPSYPLSDVVARWQKLPAATAANREQAGSAARTGCEDLQRFVIDWTRLLFAAGPMESAVGDDRVFLLNDESLKVATNQPVKFFARGRQKIARVYVSVTPLNPAASDAPSVTWTGGLVRVLRGRPNADRRETPPQQPLKSMLSEADIKRLGYTDGFTVASGTTQFFDLPVPEGAFAVELQINARIPEGTGPAVVRGTISDSDQVSKGRTTPVLLGYANSPGYNAWKAGLLAFADNLPQNSHGEPTPSDRDPIPVPFDNTYNQPERDRFHTKVKYFRTDQFLVDRVLDDESRRRLDQAWVDLRSSFDYHEQFLRFIADKYKLPLTKGIKALTPADITALPAEPRRFVNALRAELAADRKTQQAARLQQVEDCVRLAGKAWRRPLSVAEQQSLRAFYRSSRMTAALDHPAAVRSLLARILVAPAFLYRLEQPSRIAGDRALSSWEMASRLSYFLWSSPPDEELRRAAAAGELSTTTQLEHQVKRMLAEPKARRMAAEFFGQWLGFYRFDQYRGVDTTRYPEFTDQVKAAMHEEAVAFFEHIIRKDRPVREIFTADYTFLNTVLAKHYDVNKEIKADSEPELVNGASTFQRGGLLRLGAVLTATSAPLRTSPVKRGDWVLRRILGTPTPPPPADAGSIPADDKLFGGLTLFERLEAHKRNPTCASCHTRIDPLGFPLERYDAVGRVRERYADGKPVHDSAALADKTPINGVDGLLKYLQTQEPQVVKTLAQKLLGYALGRTVLLSDQPLIEQLTKTGGDTSLSALATGIVTSRQFRYRRGQEDTTPPPQRTTAHPADRSLPKEGGL